jgi:hypothetical protein
VKNIKYFPFERNKYFFGKLLGVGDFEAEQKYINDKRRIINRMLHGVGIACGLNVVRVDDSFISVESGLALDYVGREILIDAPVIKKLSMFDGFDQDKDPNDSSHVYLCMEYDEEQKEPIHSITNNLSSEENGIQYNKYREGYRLYLDYNEPEEQPSAAINLCENISKLYDEGGVCITHTMPKYIKAGSFFDFTITIEKNSLLTDIVLNYEILLECIDYKGGEKLVVNFDETTVAKSGKYELKYSLKAKQVEDVEGVCIVNPENFQLKISSIEVKLDNTKKMSTKIINADPKEEIIKEYYSISMDEIVNSTVDKKIYLAKISLVKAGNAYVIEKVENNPFKQYVFNSTLFQAIEKLERDEFDSIKDNGLFEESNYNRKPEKNSSEAKQKLDLASGVERIELLNNNKAGSIVFSKEIVHGVGLGNVYVVMGIENENKGELIFGNSSIFNSPSKFELAAKINTMDGTMMIGVKVLENIEETSVNVRWMVYRDIKEKSKDFEKATMQIKPDVCDVKVRETIYLEAVSTALKDNKCEWSIKEKEGGSIDLNGKYTAPSTPGIYEIVAKSIENPEVTSSTFVVVRDYDR